ncbi:hypothetical protein AAVH_08992 [Aphelenchoides avenae]|nr:hypothetical protein AAVH_08992 [Aphelenchus avenae]
MAQVQATAGAPHSIDFGDGHFIVRRATDAVNGSQYIFAGTDYWSTPNGETITKGSSRLLWNGTLIFDNFTKDDAGSYSLPLEKEHITCPNGPMAMLPTSLYILSVKGSE